MAIDLFSPRVMIAAVQAIKPVRTFIRDTFFSNRKTSMQETVEVQLRKGKRRLAPFVSPVIGGKVMDRMGYTVSDYKPPLVAPRTITKAEDLQKRQFGEELYDGMDPDQRAAKILGEDMVELDDAITRREEWMCAQALFAGTINMVGEGVNEVINFNHTKRVTLAAAKKWNTATGDPLADLGEWRESVMKDSGITPNVCIMATDVVDAFLANAKVQAAMDIRRIELGKIEPRELPNGATYIGTLTKLGIDIYSYYEWYVDDATGTEMPMVPAGNVLLGSTNNSFQFAYGAYTDLSENVTYAVPRYPRTWVEKGPNQRFLEMDSRPLPIPVDVDSWYVADVI
jgi:hypothetical protein